MPRDRQIIDTPVGRLSITAEDGAIVALDWVDGEAPTDATPGEAPPNPLLARAAEALDAYFAGARTTFTDLPMAPGGSAFDRRVWHALNAIPYGHHESYGALARTLGTAPRAVGGACGRNPIPILIPCHRVVGARGDAVGYSGGGGTDTKRRLLALEGARAGG